LKNALIVVQVAVSVLLLGGTSIFMQAVAANRTLRVGFAVDGVAMLETDARFAGYSESAAKTMYDDLLRRVQVVPGVEAAALLRGLPMSSTGVSIVADSATGQPEPEEVSMLEAGPGFFETLRIPLLYGRVFDARDQANTPRVAVITETMARKYFGTPDAVGRRFRLQRDPNSWTEIIGVVRDTGTGDFENDVLSPVRSRYYRSHTQSGAQATTIVARTSRDAASLLAAMQRELRAVDITLPVITAKTMAQARTDSEAAPAVVATFLAILAGLGLVLASIGLYAVVAFAVARRSREIGIRMALGARSQQVVSSIARGVAGLVGVGTGVGLFLTVLLMLVLRTSSGSADIGIGSMTVYRPSIDPLALLAIAAVTALVGVAAAFVPARRAARMHPLTALRHE
jgi:predicted permease